MQVGLSVPNVVKSHLRFEIDFVLDFGILAFLHLSLSPLLLKHFLPLLKFELLFGKNAFQMLSVCVV